MNKTRIILAVSGGVIGLAVLVAAFFTWSAFSDKTAAFEGDEESDGLETVVGQLSGLMSKKPFPSPENARQIEANRQALEDWYAAVRQRAACGDWRPVDAGTPAQFKELVGQEAKRMLAATNAAGTAVLAADFGFGPFKDYLGDKMPTKDELGRLQRQWHDLTSLVRLLVDGGVLRLSDLQVVEQKKQEAAPAQDGRAKNRKKAVSDEAGDAPSVETYKLSFSCPPAAFVGIVRELSFQDRFSVVEDFTFAHARDAIEEALKVDEKKETAAGGRRARRRAAVATSEPKDEKPRVSTAFDPETDSTLDVNLTVSIYDFRSLEDDEKEASK